MPTQPFNVIQDSMSLSELCNEVAKLQKLVRYIINGQLDFENIRARGIKADNIEAGTITGNEIAAHSITADNVAAHTITADEIAAETITSNEIAAGTITADRMNVTQLSAIAADLGTITAGSITTDTTINVGTDAVVGNNLYVGDTSTAIDRVITLKDHFLKTTDSGANLQLFGAVALLLWGFDDVEVRASFGDILLNAAGDYYLDSITSGNKIARQSQIDSLQSSKQNVISGATDVFYVSPTPGGSPTTAVTVFNGITALIVP